MQETSVYPLSCHLIFVCSTLTWLSPTAALANMANKFSRGGTHAFHEETRTEEQQKNTVPLTHQHIKHPELTNTVASLKMLSSPDAL